MVTTCLSNKYEENHVATFSFFEIESLEVMYALNVHLSAMHTFQKASVILQKKVQRKILPVSGLV